MPINTTEAEIDKYFNVQIRVSQQRLNEYLEGYLNSGEVLKWCSRIEFRYNNRVLTPQLAVDQGLFCCQWKVWERINNEAWFIMRRDWITAFQAMIKSPMPFPFEALYLICGTMDTQASIPLVNSLVQYATFGEVKYG